MPGVVLASRRGVHGISVVHSIGEGGVPDGRIRWHSRPCRQSLVAFGLVPDDGRQRANGQVGVALDSDRSQERQRWQFLAAHDLLGLGPERLERRVLDLRRVHASGDKPHDCRRKPASVTEVVVEVVACELQHIVRQGLHRGPLLAKQAQGQFDGQVQNLSLDLDFLLRERLGDKAQDVGSDALEGVTACPVFAQEPEDRALGAGEHWDRSLVLSDTGRNLLGDGFVLVQEHLSEQLERGAQVRVRDGTLLDQLSNDNDCGLLDDVRCRALEKRNHSSHAPVCHLWLSVRNTAHSAQRLAYKCLVRMTHIALKLSQDLLDITRHRETGQDLELEYGAEEWVRGLDEEIS
mmetsp:Transcript_8471/g.24085  ORF Transcript_8471/g.24085 Transcript_8471/m.24085 type:complete len:349 (-) Transcript_8471:1287-2333(-)